MKIRIVVRTTDKGAACNVGGPVESFVRTFDIEGPSDLVKYLVHREQYVHHEIVGYEIVEESGR